jgi:arylsulfatase A-like enzyme
MRKRPNIVFVFADQLRGSSLGHVGQEQVLTPNFDRFAAEGVRFSRAVSNAPLCCPMRASLITGQHPLSHGILGNDILLREDAPSIAKSLSQAGYDTAYIGKWHLDGPDRTGFTPPGPRRQGFDYWAAMNCSHSYTVFYDYRDKPEPIWGTGYQPTEHTDLALEYLADHAGGEKPFCMFLSWEPPHCPYDQVPDTYKRLYDNATPRSNAVDPDLTVTANYYAHVTALDHQFGRLLDALDTPELRENTLVVFTSDHGDMLYSHGRGWKCKPWQESVIVPFIARWPGVIPAGAVEDAPFGLVNTVPTLLSLCGVEAPAEMDGEAMPHLLTQTQGEKPTSTPIYFYMRATNPSPDVWRGVVTKNHTYARFRETPWVLYDDAADPYQMRNLAEDPAFSELQQSMETELQGWLAKLGDKFETDFKLAERYGIEVDEHGLPPYYYRPEIMRELHRRREEYAKQVSP